MARVTYPKHVKCAQCGHRFRELYFATDGKGRCVKCHDKHQKERG